MNIWKEFPKYKNLLNHIAWRQSSSYDNFQENKQETVIAYAESIQKFDPIAETSKKSFIGKCVKNHLSNKNRKKRREVSFKDLPNFDEYNPEELIIHSSAHPTQWIWEINTPESYLIFEENLNSLSENAQEVVRIILDASREIQDIINGFNRKSDRANLIEYIRWEYEWGYNKIWKIFQEIKEIIF